MIKLCAELALQQTIQIIAYSYKSRIKQGLPPLTIGRLKNRLNTSETQTHLECLYNLFSQHSDDSFIIIDKSGYIAILKHNRIIATRLHL